MHVTPQQVEERLAEKPYYMGLAQEYWGTS
jgi:hypothetical protein